MLLITLISNIYPIRYEARSDMNLDETFYSSSKEISKLLLKLPALKTYNNI